MTRKFPVGPRLAISPVKAHADLEGSRGNSSVTGPSRSRRPLATYKPVRAPLEPSCSRRFQWRYLMQASRDAHTDVLEAGHQDQMDSTGVASGENPPIARIRSPRRATGGGTCHRLGLRGRYYDAAEPERWIKAARTWPVYGWIP